MNNNIAIIILNYVQFVNIKPALSYLNQKYKVDIYCVGEYYDAGMMKMFDDFSNYLKEQNIKVYRKVQKKKYKLLLEPYPCMEIDAKYRIKYRYGNITAKPSIVMNPSQYLLYDSILCAGIYDEKYMKVFSNTNITGNMKYIGFKKKTNNMDKKILLYLPSYGDASSIDSIDNVLKDLKMIIILLQKYTMVLIIYLKKSIGKIK